MLLAVLPGLVLVSPPPTAAQIGVTDTEIVIGGSNSFTGPLAFIGEQATKYGVNLYVSAVNDAGGVHGRKIRTIFLDDGYRPEDAVANTKKLVEPEPLSGLRDHRVFAIIAPQGTVQVARTLDYLEQKNVPLLFPLQGSPHVRGRKYVFSGMMLYDRQSRMMIDYLAGPRQLRKFAALYQDDEHGRTFLGSFARDLARHQLKLVASASVSRGATDVSAQLKMLQEAKPEVLFLALTPNPTALALKQRQRMRWLDVVMVASGPLMDEQILALAGAASEGVEGLSLWPEPLSSDLSGVKLYRQHMAKYFPNNRPNRYSLSGYFAAMLFVEGAQRAGRNVTRENLVRALESIKDWDSSILPPITIGVDHETQKQGFWVKFEKGRFQQLTDWLKSE